MPINGPRNAYRPTGGADWLRFLPLVFLTLLISAVLAVLLRVLFDFGFYFAFIMPLLAVLPVVGMVYLTVAWGHCRNVVMGGLLGFVAGGVLYLGFYHVGLVQAIGLGNVHRVDLLPRYIVLHKENEVWVDVAQANPIKQKPDRVELVFNWILFALELGFILVFTSATGYTRAGRCFCEKCGRWKELSLVTLRRGSGKKLLKALEAGDREAIADLRDDLVPGQQSYTAVAIERCQETDGSTRDCPLYFSIREVSTGGGAGDYQKFDVALGRSLVRRVELAEREVADLLSLFPALKDSARIALSPSAPATPAAEAHVVRPVTCAEVMPVPEPYAGRVLTTGVKWLGNLLDIVPVFVLFAGLGLIGLTIYVLSEQPVLEVSWLVAGGVIIALGAGLSLFGLYLAFPARSLLGHLYLRWRARQEFGQRPDLLVTPDDPDALFVEVVPRANWTKMMLDTATDLGYLRVDEQRRELLFEGDRECYRIPQAALVDCRVARFLPLMSNSRMDELYMVVVEVEASDGVREIPFGPRNPSFWRSRKVREVWAIDLQNRILGVMEDPVS